MRFISLMLLAGIVQAGQVTYTDSYGPTKTDWIHVLELPKFDSALGTLTQVEVIAKSEMLTEGTIINRDQVAQTLTVHFQGKIAIDLPDVPDMDDMYASYNDTTDYPDSEPDVEIAVHDEINDTGSRLSIDLVTLAAYTGTGNITFPSLADTEAEVTGSANLSSDILTTAGITIEVVYTYDEPVVPPVDPPANKPTKGIPTMSAYGLMLMAGLLGFMAYRRK